MLAANPSVPHRHLVYRVGGKHNDIWNLHSHAGPVGTQNPIPPETDPYAAYARIFTFNATTRPRRRRSRSGSSRSSRRSTSCSARRPRLSSKLGTEDKQKLDLHMTALRDIERTLQGMTGTPVRRWAARPPASARRSTPTTTPTTSSSGDLFFKITALAFACDLTRVIQFNWSGNTSNRVYKNLGITEGHHDISHQSATESFQKIRAIHKHLWTQNLKLYEALKATPDGDGTLWDNTLVVHWNELGQGDSHTINNNLVIFAGKADNAFRRGRYSTSRTGNRSPTCSSPATTTWASERHDVRRLEARFGDGAAHRADLISTGDA